MPSIDRSDIEAAIQLLPAAEFDTSLEHEVQTDKQAVKLLPCRQCRRPLVVTTFFAAAKAICRTCTGEDPDAGVATVAVPVPGQTDPAKAIRLASCLINPQFATAVCPVHPDDEAHEMELKSINHSDDYGPGFFIKPGEWRQTAKGETVMHQCKACMAVVSYSTRHVVQYRCQNEPKQQPDFGAPHRASILGVRPEPADPTAPGVKRVAA